MKAIDPKFHIEIDLTRPGDEDQVSIVKTSNGEPIPDDEPLILFRARDRNALATLEFYRDLCRADGCNDFHDAGIQNRIEAFRQFRIDQPERIKQPGITRGL